MKTKSALTMFVRTGSLLIVLTFLTILFVAIQAQPIGGDKALAVNQGISENKSTVGPDFLWEFYKGSEAYEEAPLCQNLVDPIFGTTIACLRAQVDARYNEKEQPVPGDPTVRMHLLKPDVYKAVRNISKHYRKEMDRNPDHAGLLVQYEYVLRVALAILYAEPTDTFEEALKAERKNTVNQIALFKKVKLL